MLEAVADPSTGVTNVGDVANTKAPLPVSLVIAEARFALVGVAKAVATPVPRPVTPPTGNVQLVSVPLVGVPRIGVTRVGDVLNTARLVPVSSLSCEANPAEFVKPEDVATAPRAYGSNASNRIIGVSRFMFATK